MRDDVRDEQRPPEPGAPEYLTLVEAAELLGFHPRTVLKYVRRGELEGRLIGGRWTFRRQDIDAFFDAAPVQWEFCSESVTRKPATGNERQKD